MPEVFEWYQTELHAARYHTVVPRLNKFTVSYSEAVVDQLDKNCSPFTVFTGTRCWWIISCFPSLLLNYLFIFICVLPYDTVYISNYVMSMRVLLVNGELKDTGKAEKWPSPGTFIIQVPGGSWKVTKPQVRETCVPVQITITHVSNERFLRCHRHFRSLSFDHPSKMSQSMHMVRATVQSSPSSS